MKITTSDPVIAAIDRLARAARRAADKILQEGGCDYKDTMELKRAVRGFDRACIARLANILAPQHLVGQNRERKGNPSKQRGRG